MEKPTIEEARLTTLDPAPPVPIAAGWRRLKSLLVFVLILGLVTMNVVTVVSEDFHDSLHGTLESLGIAAALEGLFHVASGSASPPRAPVESRRRKLKMIEAENGALKVRQFRLADENKLLLERESGARKLAVELKEENVALNKRVLVTEKAHADMKGEVQRKNARVAQISQAIAKRSMTNATRNTVSLAAEAIPYVGVGVMLGVTAADLRDACNTMKDLRQIDETIESPLADDTVVCGMRVPSFQEVMSQVTSNSRGAYAEAARVVNEGREKVIASELPKVTWAEAKGSLCAALQSMPGCPR